MGSRHAAGTAAGFTFPEIAIGLTIFVLAAAVLINHLTISYRTTATERDRVFAYGKAQAILAEIQGYVDRGEVSAAVDLDALDDGVTNKPTLTITTDGNRQLVAPDHVLSGNYRRDNQWVWSRRITVQPFQGLNNRNVRYVTVRIYRRGQGQGDDPVADLSAVINSAGSAFPTTQVFDVYLLAVESIPGWWVYMDSIRPFVESTITDLETRNPGLEVRTHWITKASYGRNQLYRPFINERRDSHQDIPDTYFYPGRMPAGSSSTYYYVPGNFKARISRDGVDVNGYDGVRNPHPYAVADFWNHAMRYPDELALHQRRLAAVAAREAEIAAAQAAGITPPPELDDMSKEPTLRLFLEDLNTNPDRYRNALIINLHGELLPMPPLRNHSDPAKEPENFREMRVVTHPEELRTRRDSTAIDPVRLRVYAFTTNAQTYTTPATLGAPIAVEVMGMNLMDPGTSRPVLHPSVQIQNLRGGVPVGGTSDYFMMSAAKWETNPPSNPSPPLSGEMYYRAEYVDPGPGQEKFTRIYLFNTPVVAPYVGTKGINANKRSQLYRMNYVPSATEAARDFSRDLNAMGDGPKNTARWRITIPGSAFADQLFRDNNGNAYNPGDDVVLRVRTRIWSGATPERSGTSWPPDQLYQPDNLSTTYTWWADSPDDVPITERNQFNGDPRHNPYKDLLNSNSEDFPNGYNWYHDLLANSGENSAADYPGIDATRLRNRWRGRMFVDVPRYFELLRNGLLASRCVFTTLTGFSYFYLGVGNDIGYDSANGYANSIPSTLRPFGAPGTGFINTITGARTLVRESGGGSNYWFGMPWLGELYPDSHYLSQWLAPADAAGNPRGNLTSGPSNNEFFQAAFTGTYGGSNRTAFGTALAAPQQRLQEEGCTSFFNIGTATSTFHHEYSSGNGVLTGAGPEIAARYSFTMPPTAPISRPFGLATNSAGTVGDEWNFAPYTARASATLLRTYYNHPTGRIGSGLVKLTDSTNANAAYVVVNGIDRTVESGSSFIARFSLLSLVHSFFEAGATTNPHRIQQPARLSIASPTDISELANPDRIPIQLDVTWRRWDGQTYTASVSPTEVEAQLDYVLMYSRDGGDSWRYIQDDVPATPGQRPASSAHLVRDTTPGQETIQWSVPASRFPEGSYLLLVECYRQDAAIHYSYHKTKFYIQR